MDSEAALLLRLARRKALGGQASGVELARPDATAAFLLRRWRRFRGGFVWRLNRFVCRLRCRWRSWIRQVLPDCLSLRFCLAKEKPRRTTAAKQHEQHNEARQDERRQTTATVALFVAHAGQCAALRSGLQPFAALDADRRGSACRG